MIELRKDITPSEETLNKLKEYQCEIDILSTFTERSQKAKKLFPSKNKKANVAFKKVKEYLTQLCNSTRRCVYCEDSLADEVEHIYPKDLYPEKCFHWNNYLYACGPCNGPKNNQFAVFRKDNGEFQYVNPQKGELSNEPPKGEAAFINPREENPMDFCILDLNGTFKFQPIPLLSEKDKKKVDYTFNTVLRLNDPEREPIRQARENAYDNYKSRLFCFIEQKKQNTSEEKLLRMIEGLKKENHPTVWKEMQRYHQKGWLKNIDEELDKMFNSEPDALNW